MTMRKPLEGKLRKMPRKIWKNGDMKSGQYQELVKER